MKKIGLIYRDGALQIELYVGDTMSQARDFYGSEITLKRLNNLKNWRLRCNFHVSFIQKNLVWFKSAVTVDQYIRFWVDNPKKIYQCGREDIADLLRNLVEQKIIVYGDDKIKEMEDNFFKTNRLTLNICPGLGIIFPMSLTDVAKKDQSSELENLISEKIKEGLSVVNIDWRRVLR